MNAYLLAFQRCGLSSALLCALGACGADAQPGAGAGGSDAGGTGGASGLGGSGGGDGGGSGGGGGGDAGAGAGGGTGGSSGLGGSGGSDTTNVSRTDACLTYEVARRKRIDECSGLPVLSDAAYARQAPNCPDVYFSEGSTRTIDGLIACAEVFRTFDCGLLTMARVPDCVTDGTLSAGTPCVFGPQCDSLVCDGFNTECGTCVMRLGPGASCAVGTGICVQGYSCSDGTCKENLEVEPMEPPIVPDPDGSVPTGGACVSTEECMGEDLCLGDGAGMQVCTARVALNGSCNGPTLYCDESTYCSPDFVCLALPGDGEPCGLSFDSPRWCAEGLTCVLDPAGALCKPIAGSDGCSASGIECPDDSICCSTPECATTMCVRVALPGDACGDASARCIDGAECMNGTCEGIDSRGLVEELCGP
jgi:hypothetical protein